jgi:hypothetical protein
MIARRKQSKSSSEAIYLRRLALVVTGRVPPFIRNDRLSAHRPLCIVLLKVFQKDIHLPQPVMSALASSGVTRITSDFLLTFEDVEVISASHGNRCLPYTCRLAALQLQKCIDPPVYVEIW